MSENDIARDIEQARKQIKDFEGAVALRDSAIKLHSNREFKKVFLDDYWDGEIKRLMFLSADLSLTKEQRNDCLEMAQGAAHAKRYLSILIQRGNVCESQLEDMRASLEEMEETFRVESQEDEPQTEAPAGDAAAANAEVLG